LAGGGGVVVVVVALRILTPEEIGLLRKGVRRLRGRRPPGSPEPQPSSA
jgi:hypothetical protein